MIDIIIIRESLKKHNGNVSKVARLLGVSKYKVDKVKASVIRSKAANKRAAKKT